jgi:hypothetical protein
VGVRRGRTQVRTAVISWDLCLPIRRPVMVMALEDSTLSDAVGLEPGETLIRIPFTMGVVKCHIGLHRSPT